MTSLALENERFMAPPQLVQTARILVVDDEDTIRLVLAKYLRTRGFDVATAESGEAALEALSEHRFDLMLCDVRMPGLSGVETLAPAREIDPDLGIVMLSAVNDAPTAADAMAQGVLDYLTKPIELAQLHESVNRALHKRTMLREQRRVEHAIREEVDLRTRELEREKAQLRALVVATIETLVNAMEAKDVYQRGHSARVGELAASIAEQLQLPPDVVEDVRIAGRLHDVGNIGVASEVLNKPGPLSPEEYAHIRAHVRIGVEILSPLRHIERAVLFVADHHEHWDGGGYPRTKVGEQISIGGRVLAAADTFDALVSRRSFRASKTPDEALEEMRRTVGTCLDPRVYEALRGVVKSRKSLTFVDPAHA